MKKILSGIALCFAFIASTNAQQPSNTTIKVGQKAPDLAYNNPDGTQIKLSEIAKGRVVLLDFWASWCGPCRQTSPQVVAIYNKYKDKAFKGAKNGFTIVSVSLDQKKEAWLAAITADGLTWPYQMSDLGGWASKPAATYGIQFIPQAFLIGADGTIKGMYTFAGQSETDIAKLLK